MRQAFEDTLTRYRDNDRHKILLSVDLGKRKCISSCRSQRGQPSSILQKHSHPPTAQRRARDSRYGSTDAGSERPATGKSGVHQRDDWAGWNHVPAGRRLRLPHTDRR